MGFWIFGNKKRRSSKVDETSTQPKEKPQTPETPMGSSAMAQSARGTPSRTDSNQRRREKATNNLSRSSFRDSKTPSSRDQASPYTPATSSRQTPTDPFDEKSQTKRESSTRLGKQRQDDAIYREPLNSQSSIQQESFSVTKPIPTLNAKRNGTPFAADRRKSSKRNADDSARERQIKAMSPPIPIPRRPTSEIGGGPLRKESRRVPGVFDRPTSHVSLPLSENLPDMSEVENQNSFRVSALSALSPRPTIRYNASPKYTSRSRPATRIEPKDLIVEEDFTSKRRIDNLADSLDSGGLRELMERDKRRRERKKESDRKKLERRLQRRADKQKEDEARKTAPSDGPGATPERRRLAETSGLNLETDMSSSPPMSASAEGKTNDQEWTKTPIVMVRNIGKENVPPSNPFLDPQDKDPFIDPPTEQTEPMLPVRSPLRDTKQSAGLATASQMSPPSSPVRQPVERSSMSQMSLQPSESTAERSDSTRPKSQQPETVQSSWTAFFSRGRRNRTSFDKGAPSEFSNTSRESFARKQQTQAQLQAAAGPNPADRTFRRSTSGVPKRTQSRFREDLPELPISPPDSRLQSPETTALPPFAPKDYPEPPLPPSEAKSREGSTSIPILDRSGQDDRSSIQKSIDLQSVEAGPSAGLSQSLASVDSEGSWLSGRPTKRGSVKSILAHPLRQSQPPLPLAEPDSIEGEQPETDIVEDEYFKRLSPPPVDVGKSSFESKRKPSSTALEHEAIESPPEEPPPLPDQSSERWHGNLARTPTLVKQQSRAKSKEGLLSQFQAGESAKIGGGSSSDSDADDESPDADDDKLAPFEATSSPILRAQSVEYGKGHARQISAGSARLLDIRRSSVHSQASSAAGDRGSIALARGQSLRSSRDELSRLSTLEPMRPGDASARSTTPEPPKQT